MDERIQQAKDRARTSIESREKILQAFQGHIEHQTNTLQFALWNVGVAAPGLLGLLSNVRTIQACSKLGPLILASLYRTSELFLIASIFVAVILYRRTNKQLGRLETARMLNHVMISNTLTALAKLEAALAKQEAGQIAEETNSPSGELADRAMKHMDAFNSEVESRWKHLPDIQQFCLAVGYIGAALIFLSVKFWPLPCG